MATLIAVSNYTDTSILAHTPKGTENDEGVSCYWLDHATGALKPAGSLNVGPNPAFLLQHPDDPATLYAATERIDEDGEVLSLRLHRDGDAIQLNVADRTSARGKSTCYLALDASRKWLRATNYWEASVVVLPVAGPALGEKAADHHALPPKAALRAAGKDIAQRCAEPSSYCATQNPSREEHWKYRQRWPHAHCVVTEPYAQKTHFVVDLGEDAVYHYGFDDAVGRLTCRGSTRLERGKGPRHVVFHPTRKACFIVQELSSTVSAFVYNDTTHEGVLDATDPKATLQLQQCISTLPDGYDNAHHCVNGIWKAQSHSSEIRLDATGSWLFVGNRGHDSLAVFEVTFDGASPQLRRAHVVPTGGKCPRNFAVLDSHIVVGNQDTDELVVFKREADGDLTEVSRVHHRSPNFLVPLVAPPVEQATIDKATLPRVRSGLAGVFEPPPPPLASPAKPVVAPPKVSLRVLDAAADALAYAGAIGAVGCAVAYWAL